MKFLFFIFFGYIFFRVVFIFMKRFQLLAFIQKKLIAFIANAIAQKNSKSPLDKVIDLCPECGDVIYPGGKHKCPDNR